MHINTLLFKPYSKIISTSFKIKSDINCKSFNSNYILKNHYTLSILLNKLKVDRVGAEFSSNNLKGLELSERHPLFVFADVCSGSEHILIHTQLNLVECALKFDNPIRNLLKSNSRFHILHESHAFETFISTAIPCDQHDKLP